MLTKREYITLLIISLSFLISIYMYPSLPEKMASHWNIKGIADSYVPKLVGAFMIPLTLLMFLAIFIAIPVIDPLKENIKIVRRQFDNFIIVLFLFMILLHVQIIAWSVGFLMPMSATLPIGIGILIYYAGVLCEHAKKPSWFIGVRTPWSMSSQAVWKKTNVLAGKLFKASGVISVAGIFAGEYAFYFVLLPITAFSIYTVVYSYIEYRKIESKRKRKK